MDEREVRDEISIVRTERYAEYGGGGAGTVDEDTQRQTINGTGNYKVTTIYS